MNSKFKKRNGLYSDVVCKLCKIKMSPTCPKIEPMQSPRFLQHTLYFPALIGPCNGRKMFSLTYDLKLFVQYRLILVFKAVPWLMWLVTGLLRQRPGFGPKPIYMRFVVEKVALKQGFLCVIQFFLSVSFLQCYILVFIYTFLLLKGQRVEAQEPSTMQ